MKRVEAPPETSSGPRALHLSLEEMIPVLPVKGKAFRADTSAPAQLLDPEAAPTHQPTDTDRAKGRRLQSGPTTVLRGGTRRRQTPLRVVEIERAQRRARQAVARSRSSSKVDRRYEHKARKASVPLPFLESRLRTRCSEERWYIRRLCHFFFNGVTPPFILLFLLTLIHLCAPSSLR